VTTPWPAAEPLRSARLDLEPLRTDHADETAAALDDAGLHTFTGGSPATAGELRDRCARQVVGHSADGGEGWLNWVLRRRDDGALVGTAQATVRRAADGAREAELAWVVATVHQGAGHAREAAAVVSHWLRAQGVHRLVAHVHPGHTASMGVARAIGLHPTSTVVDGEVRWSS